MFEITILARLQTRLDQGPGLLHEVRCEPFGPLHVGDGLHRHDCRCGLLLGCDPQRDWSLGIPADRFGKRLEIVDAGLVRFTVQDRHRHWLRAWYPVGAMRYIDAGLELSGNLSFGGFDGSIAEARTWLENPRRLPDCAYRLYEWQRRTGQTLLAGYPRTEDDFWQADWDAKHRSTTAEHNKQWSRFLAAQRRLHPATERTA